MTKYVRNPDIFFLIFPPSLSDLHNTTSRTPLAQFWFAFFEKNSKMSESSCVGKQPRQKSSKAKRKKSSAPSVGKPPPPEAPINDAVVKAFDADGVSMHLFSLFLCFFPNFHPLLYKIWLRLGILITRLASFVSFCMYRLYCGPTMI